ncbi:hypothetical protein HJC23_007554 [Cyclotella cryptica]|uniref:SOUL heme-binding protein n=1 Tax=Cyclotella cryptica TaxID=29204 RepID=A0ABD3QRM8_9STRA|eukprot:CCRYP_002826-RA/>CCRYP_002826-RA protein AED:0.03 eAED:-0.02 QI:0/-1/0/1/-1/1/1/0/252
MKLNYSSIQINSIWQVLLTVAASIITLRIGAGLAAWRAANQLERPNYTVVRRLPINPRQRRGEIEIRKYEPYLIAETTIDESSMRKAGSLGFGKCAGYIFGKNTPVGKSEQPEKMAMTAPVRSVGEVSSGEKMAMTSPVRSQGNKKGKTKISFVIGSKYTLQNVPKPTDKSVRVKRVDGHYLAASTFSGPPPSDERVREERSKLVQTCEREGIRIKGGKNETFVYGYHDPVVTPNILRRNEVCVEVDGSSLN